MANTKISALTAATTPLAGTEVLPIVQSGATVKVANNDLRPKQIQSNATSGVMQITGPAAASTRVMTTPDANFTVARTDAAQSFTGDQTLSTGNLVIGTSGKGIDFSATPGTGTSELFADYEEGTWTPTDGSGAGLTFTTANGAYTKIGRMVYWQALVVYPVTVNANSASIGGLPFSLAVVSGVAGRSGSTITATDEATLVQSLQIETSNTVRFYKAGFVQNTNAELSGNSIYCAGFYST